MRSKFTYFFLLVWLIPLVGFSQATSTIEIKGDVDDLNTGAGLSGVTVSVYKNGSLLESVVTGSGGKYKIKKIDADGVITVKFSKPGFVGKYAEIDASGIHPEDAGIFPLEVSTSIFEQIPDVDFSILDSKPVAKAKYVKGVDNIEWDIAYIEKVKKDVEKIMAKAEDIKKAQADAAAANEKKFNDAVAAGNAAVTTGDYANAIKKYNEALTVKDDADVKKKIVDAETKMKEANSKAETDKKYNDLMAEAKKFFDAKDYANAKQKYQNASTVKTTEVAPKEKIKEIDGILAKQMEDETKYNKYLVDGDKALLNSRYDEAIVQFTEASKMRPNEQQPKDQLKKAQDAKKAAEADALAEKKKKEDFDKFVLAAEQNVTAKKYDDAIANYDKALALMDDAGVKTKKNNAIKAKEADFAATQKAEEEKKKERIRRDEYDKLMKKGGEEMTATEYEKAIGTFESALIIFPKDLPAEAKLAEAKKKRDEKLANDKLAEAEKLKKEKFDALLIRGDGEVGKTEFDKAIATFKEALAIIKDEPTAKTKLAEAEKKKADYLKNKADFDKLVSEGDVAAATKKYDEAIAKYEKALVVNQDAAVKSKLDKAISDKDAANIALENENKKKQEKFDALLIRGDGEVGKTEYDKAIATFKEALLIIKDEPTAKTKLAEAEKKKADYVKNKADFDKLVSEGDVAAATKKYDEAIAKYEKALVIIQDPAVKSKLDKVKSDKDAANIASENDNKKKQEKFDALLIRGDGEVGKTEYDKAIATFKEALLIIKDEPTAKTKLAEAEKKKADYVKNKADFDKLVSEGDIAATTKKYDEAIAKYEKALVITQDAAVKSKLDKVKSDRDLTLGVAEAEKKKKEDFAKLIVEGDAEVKTENFDAAIAKFEEALKLIPKEASAETKLADAKKKRDNKLKNNQQAEELKKKQEKFDALLIKGDGELEKTEYDKAIATFKEALAILKDEPTAKTKLANAEKKKADYIKKKADFDKLVSEGDIAATTKKYDEAIAKYEKALVIIQDAAVKSKLDKVKSDRDLTLGVAEAEKKKKEDFAKLIVEGDAEVKTENFDAAITKFEEALKLIPKEASAETKLADAKKKRDNKLKNNQQAEELKKKQEKFDQLIAQGDSEVSASSFDKAITSYNAAIAILKDEPTAKTKLANAEKKKKEFDLANKSAEEQKKLAEADYLNHYNAGKNFSNGSEFEKAITEFEAALLIKPKDKDATTNLELAKQRLADFQATKDQAYKDRVAMADKLFGEGNYIDARVQYVKANNQRPIDEHPKNRIKECDEKLANEGEMKKLRQQFDAAILSGDNELKVKNYDKAIAFYEAAKIILPKETTPDVKIEEANRLKDLAKSEKDAAAKRKKFDLLMNEGNAFMTPGEFELAIGKYEEALKVIPSETTAEAALALAKKRKKEKEEELDKEIQRYLEFADKEFAASNWKDALKYYEKYEKYKKNDPYLTSQIAKCKEKIKSSQSNDELQVNYDALVKEGNKLFGEKKYKESKQKFVGALTIFKSQEYPKKKIAEIDEILANQQQENTQQVNNQIKKDKKGPNYGEKTIMSADEALALLQAAKLGDEKDKYAFIQSKKDKMSKDAQSIDKTAGETREENFTDIKSQKDLQKDYSQNTDLRDENTEKYRDKQLQLEAETKKWNNENDIAKINKAYVQSQYDHRDMNQYEERIRIINSKEINADKDNLSSANKAIDSQAATTRNDNGKDLVAKKDLLNDRYSANGELLMDRNSKEINSEFETLNNLNKEQNEKANTIREQNKDELKEENDILIKQNKINQEKLMTENSNQVKDEFLNQHNTNQYINSEAEKKRNEKSLDMNQRKDDFVAQNKFATDKLLKENADETKNKFESQHSSNAEMKEQAADIRNENSEILTARQDDLVMQQKTSQEKLMTENSNQVKDEFLNQHNTNQYINSEAEKKRNEKSLDMNQRKDDFVAQNKFATDKLLKENADETKNKFETQHSSNAEMKEQAADIRNENSEILTARQDDLVLQQKTSQEKLLDENNAQVKNEFDVLNAQNDAIDKQSAQIRNLNGEILNDKKDLLANTTNQTSTKILEENGEQVKNEYEMLNEQNDRMDQTAADIRNKNSEELTKQQKDLKNTYIKGGESQAQKIKSLKERQEEQVREQKSNQAAAEKKRWSNGQDLQDQKDQDMVFEKGQDGYQSSYTIEYPQGVTEEVYTRQDDDQNVSEVTIRRIVVKGEYGNEYRKVVSKSGTYYFKNGKTVTNQTWDMEAAK